MADSEREEKLAAARKRLKKFQKNRTPSSSPAVRKTYSNSSVASSNSSSKSPNSSLPVVQNVKEVNHLDVLLDTSSESSLDKDFEKIQSPLAKDANPQFDTQDAMPTKGVVGIHAPVVSNGRDISTADKIRQICHQLNGLMNQDFVINGEDPVISEIEALENRNHDLEETLQSHRRSNEHLNNQVNEQRKQILHFQEQIKRERTELANRQLLQQRSLKEQLEVHIQTIGILVGEKQELQGSVSQLQRKYQMKESENSELSGRLQAVRQKIVELERNNASLSANLEKYQGDFNHVRQERDKYQTANYAHGREKDELAQQNAELKVKLEAKVSECEVLEKATSELTFKLTQAELIVQQLSTEPNVAVTQNLVQQIKEEKTELENKLEQLNKSLQRHEVDKDEQLQRHADELDQFGNRTRSLQQQVEALEKEKVDWRDRELELQEKIENMEGSFADLEEDEVSQHVAATQQAAVEIEKLAEEKYRLGEHLQNQARENAKLVREENRYLNRIHELEITVSRLEEEADDRAALLETVESDKETISRALKQNKELKTKLEEIEDRFIKMSNENMELATNLVTEKHVAKELAIKLSDTAVELEDTKESLVQSNGELTSVREEFQTVSEQMNGKSAELTSLHDEHEVSLQGLREQLAQKDFELSSVREEVATTSHRLTEQVHFQLNEHHEQYEEQIVKMNTLYQQLQHSEETINQLLQENKHLRTVLDRADETESEGSDISSAEEVQYKEEDMRNVQHSQGDVSSDTDELHIQKVPLEEDPMITQTMYQQEGSYINADMYRGSHEETDSGDEMNMVPYRQERSSPPMSKYTNREDVIDGLSASIRQLELERDQMANILQGYQDNHENDLQQLHEHMQLQLQQQLKQQYKQVQEQFQQLLHELQQKIQLLQEVLERQKLQIERQSDQEMANPAIKMDENHENLSYEAIKLAFGKLQAKFMKLMGEKASLVDRIQELEHLTVQLSEETETIGEYITLYQTQRTALKAYYNDRERIVTQLSNEKGDMQNKMSQLQALVKQLLDERKDLRYQKHQLQNMLNKRLLAHEHEPVIPGYQEGDEVIVAKHAEHEGLRTEPDNSSVKSDNSMDSGRESPSHIHDIESDYHKPESEDQEELLDDGTAQQILQLLEQLGHSEEGGEKGWVSPAVRSREFLPCRHCNLNRVLQL